MMNCPRWLIFILLITLFAPASTEESFTLGYSGGGRFYQVERANLSKYVNDRYTGLTHRETRALIYPAQRGGRTVYTGDFFVFEETLRDMVAVARQVDEIRPVSFTVSENGTMQFLEDTGFPRMRSFPTYPAEPLKPGQRWQAEAERVIDPLNNGILTYLPVYVEYQFIGPEMYRNIPVYRIKAKYASRYDQYRRRRGDDPSLLRATGTHDVDILVNRETGDPILILNRLDETFFYADGTSVRFRGSSALFSETPVPVKRETVLPALDTLIARASPPAGTVRTPLPPTEDSMGLENGSAGRGTPVQPPPAAPSRPLQPPVQQPPATPSQPVQPAAPARPGTAPGTSPQAFEVEETDRGIRLSVRDIRFVPDSDEILASEIWRIEAIAEALKLMGDRQFLVEGHTAAIGLPQGELELSVKRAQRITDELVKRGIQAGRIIFIGHGGTRPLADNTTAEGRALNRRVEITVLE